MEAIVYVVCIVLFGAVIWWQHDQIKMLKAERDSETRWANQYHRQAEKAEAEASRVEVCYGFEAAREAVEDYLTGS